MKRKMEQHGGQQQQQQETQPQQQAQLTLQQQQFLLQHQQQIMQQQQHSQATPMQQQPQLLQPNSQNMQLQQSMLAGLPSMNIQDFAQTFAQQQSMNGSNFAGGNNDSNSSTEDKDDPVNSLMADGNDSNSATGDKLSDDQVNSFSDRLAQLTGNMASGGKKTKARRNSGAKPRRNSKTAAGAKKKAKGAADGQGASKRPRAGTPLVTPPETPFVSSGALSSKGGVKHNVVPVASMLHTRLPQMQQQQQQQQVQGQPMAMQPPPALAGLGMANFAQTAQQMVANNNGNSSDMMAMLQNLQKAMGGNGQANGHTNLQISLSSGINLNNNNNNNQSAAGNSRTSASSQTQRSPFMGPAPGLPSIDQLSAHAAGAPLMTTLEASEKELLTEFEAPELDGLGSHIEEL